MRPGTMAQGEIRLIYKWKYNLPTLKKYLQTSKN